MAIIETMPGEVAVTGKLCRSSGRYLISISNDYTAELDKITSKRALVKVEPLV